MCQKKEYIWKNLYFRLFWFKSIEKCSRATGACNWKDSAAIQKRLDGNDFFLTADDCGRKHAGTATALTAWLRKLVSINLYNRIYDFAMYFDCGMTADGIIVKKKLTAEWLRTRRYFLVFFEIFGSNRNGWKKNNKMRAMKKKGTGEKKTTNEQKT